MVTSEITFDQVLNLALRLRPIDQARLVVRLAPRIELLVEQVESHSPNLVRKSLRGLLADLGPAPSADEIDGVQHEMWATLK